MFEITLLLGLYLLFRYATLLTSIIYIIPSEIFINYILLTVIELLIVFLVFRNLFRNKSTKKYEQKSRAQADKYYCTRKEEGDVYYLTKVKEANDYINKSISEANNYKSELKLQTLKEYNTNLQEQILRKDELNNSIKNHTSDIISLICIKEFLLQEINELENDSLIINFDDFIIEKNSELIKDSQILIRNEIKNLIKHNNAVNDFGLKTLNRSFLFRLNTRCIIRLFEAETALILNNLTSTNVDRQREKLSKSFYAINKLFEQNGLELTTDYLNLKLQEANLIYSYQLQKSIEKEEQKAIKQQMLEEQKVLREIEREKAKVQKEESRYKNEITKLYSYLRKSTDIEKSLYINKIQELETQLKNLENIKANILEREQNTRAGNVYVISNIGSFGENIYKIGMTRRLEPLDRIKELSSASVPFDFDIHAMIFSDDAYELETILHNKFRDKQVNKVNSRKEFFNVNLSEIENVVKENYNATVTFTHFAKAEQYRESLKLSANLSKTHN